MLRIGGVEAGPARTISAIEALEAVDLGIRDDVYWALRCTLTFGEEEGVVFDRAFNAFFKYGSELAVPDTPLPKGAPEADAELAGARSERRRLGDEVPEAELGEELSAGLRRAASQHERLETLDLREYDATDLRAGREHLERLVRQLPRRRSGRLRPAHRGPRLDMRATARQAMRSDGLPLERRWREQKLVPRRLVFLLDVSGSMEAYARPSVMMLQALVASGSPVEAFVFGTRLTRLTQYLGGRDPERALRRAAKAVPDWAGGTRIGENLLAFERIWGRRAITRGAIVTIVSDGWECGDVGELETAMARLRRSAHTLVWVNPLTGDPRYEPLAAGMAAALPHIDLFLPGHDLRSLGGLIGALGAIQGRHGVKKA
jgi:uncharacterized protein with von Willebrand factor type A (vWA) domain